MGIGVRGFYIKIERSDDFLDFSLDGSWGGLVVCKRLPQGVRTISTPGKSHSENFLFRDFVGLPNPCFPEVYLVL